MKQYRQIIPKTKGSIAIGYGRDEDGNIGVVFGWNGVDKADANLVYHALGSKRCGPNWKAKPGDFLDHFSWEPSVFDELERRGYDLTTLKFSIQKKVIK